MRMNPAVRRSAASPCAAVPSARRVSRCPRTSKHGSSVCAFVEPGIDGHLEFVELHPARLYAVAVRRGCGAGSGRAPCPSRLRRCVGGRSWPWCGAASPVPSAGTCRVVADAHVVVSVWSTNTASAARRRCRPRRRARDPACRRQEEALRRGRVRGRGSPPGRRCRRRRCTSRPG